jgi:hypothetical protein
MLSSADKGSADMALVTVIGRAGFSSILLFMEEWQATAIDTIMTNSKREKAFMIIFFSKTSPGTGWKYKSKKCCVHPALSSWMNRAI